MELIRIIRGRRGLSQRALAQRAGLSFRGVQLLESAEHDARVSSVEHVAEAFGLPASGVRRAVSRVLLEPPGSLFCASVRMVEDGERSWRGHVMDAVDAVRRSRSGAELPARLRALLAGVAETLAGECGASAPNWTSGVGPLDRPWFVSGYENLKASALVESPVPFRSRNVFVLANFLERA